MSKIVTTGSHPGSTARKPVSVAIPTQGVPVTVFKDIFTDDDLLTVDSTPAGKRLRFSDSFKNSFRVGLTDYAPSGDSATEADVSNILAFLATHDEIRLAPGDYYVQAKWALPKGKRMRCIGGNARFLPGTQWVDGAADDNAADCVLDIVGDTTVTVNTTLSVAPISGNRTITLTSVANITAGMWLRIRFQNSSAAIFIFNAKVVAPPSGNVVTLDRIVPMNGNLNGAGALGPVVQSVDPWIASDESKPTLEGIEFDWTGKKNAVGVRVLNADGVWFDRVSGTGFSRTVIHVDVAARFDTYELYSSGNNNGLIHVDNIHYGENVNCKAEGWLGRVHAFGVPRAAVRRGPGCVAWNQNNLHTVGVAGGFDYSGGDGCKLDGFFADDIDATEIQTRNPDFTGPTLPYGAAINGSPAAVGPLTYPWSWVASFGRSNTYTNITILRFRGRYQDATSCGIFAHDDLTANWSNVNVYNVGPAYNQGIYSTAIRINDTFPSSWTNIMIRGGTWGIHTRNLGGCRMKNVTIDGDGPVGGASMASALIIGHGANSFEIDGLYIGNAGYAIQFEVGSEFASNPGLNCRIKNAQIDGFYHEEIIFVPCNAGANPTWSDVLTIAADATMATAPATMNGIMAAYLKTANFVPVSVKGGLAKLSGAATPGDFLQANASNQLVVTASPVANTSYYQCLSTTGGYVHTLKVA